MAATSSEKIIYAILSSKVNTPIAIKMKKAASDKIMGR